MLLSGLISTVSANSRSNDALVGVNSGNNISTPSYPLPGTHSHPQAQPHTQPAHTAHTVHSHTQPAATMSVRCSEQIVKAALIIVVNIVILTAVVVAIVIVGVVMAGMAAIAEVGRRVMRSSQHSAVRAADIAYHAIERYDGRVGGG